MSGIIKLTDIEGDAVPGLLSGNNGFRMPELSLNGDLDVSNTNTEDFVVNIVKGWSNIGFPFDLSTVTKIVYNDANGDFVSEQTNITYETVYYYYKPSTGQVYKTDTETQSYEDQGFQLDEHDSINLNILLAGVHNDGNLIIAKDYLGSAFLPEFNYNGIGSLSKYEGLQIKTNNACQLVFTAARNSRLIGGNIQYGSDVKIGEGWSIINYGNKHPISAEEFCETYVEDLIILKNFNGNAYLPEWNFNGVGDLIPGESYQIKMPDDTFQDYFIDENE